MKKGIIISIGTGLLFSLFAAILYPKPAEIIGLLFIGLFVLILLVAGYSKIEKTQQAKGKGNSVFKYLFLALLTIYLFAFIIILRVSWWEKRIVFNIFNTQRGKAYIGITIGVLLIVLIYYLGFYKKHGTWPKDKDLGIKKKDI